MTQEQEKLAAQIAVCEEEKRALEARLTQELAAVSATASTLEASKAELVKEKEALQTANSTLEEVSLGHLLGGDRRLTSPSLSSRRSAATTASR